MGFSQLYYTSCETGLSGFAGFQFNAATPGISPEVLRSVEALTSYKPPRSLGARPTAAEIAACPVNLVYTLEPATILAKVIFAGTDFSHRSGNYFAHALVSDNGTDAFEKILPIELWDSGMWESEPVSDTNLPVLPQLREPLPDGMVSRGEVSRFLGGGARSEQLVTLLTAAENAVLRDGRPIVIVDPGPATAAQWIAAISFLLPPEVARMLSFATYHHNPGYINVHVIGTTPDSDFDLNDGAFRSYVVLDGDTGRISEVEPAPAAALLVRAGPRKAAALWERAGELADIPGAALADWHPALAMAALVDGEEVTEADLDVLSDWLQNEAGRLRPGNSGAALRAFLASPSRQPRHLAAFGALPGLAADPGLAEQVERAVVAEELRQLTTASGDQAGTGVRLTTAAGREFATQQCAEQLSSAPAKTALSLLGWSTEHGLTLPGAVLRECGEHVLGPQLILAPDEDTIGVVAGAPALAEGVVAHLAAVVAEQPEAVERAFAAGLGDIAADAAVVLPAGLGEAAVLATARSHPEKRADALREIVTRNQQLGRDDRVTEGLLSRIWPAGRWTTAEALAVVQAFGAERIPAGPILDWVSRTVLDPPRDVGYLRPYQELCQVLEPAASGLLPKQAAERRASFLGVAAEIKRVKKEPDEVRAKIIRNLAAGYGRQPPPAQDLLRPALAAQPEHMTGSRYLGSAVATYPEPVVSAFLDTARQRLAAAPPDIGAAARLFRCLVALEDANDGVLAPGLDHVLVESLGRWRRVDLNRLHERLRALNPAAADVFDNWRQQLGTTGTHRSWRRFLGSRSRSRP